MGKLHQALEEVESALVECEEALGAESSVPPEPCRPQIQRSMDLLSIPQLCQELGMCRSWVYKRIRSGEIPSVKLSKNIKVTREDLEQYLEKKRYQPSGE
jgi:excisionase family DNA binding protein